MAGRDVEGLGLDAEKLRETREYAPRMHCWELD